MLSDHLTGAFKHLAQSVKKGGTAQLSSVEPEHPMWLTFARSMGGLMVRAAESLAELLSLDSSRNSKVLDVAAGHGVWGIAFAKKYPLAHVVALDWGPVLNVALENANKAGVSERFSTIAGNAFDVPLGANYDVVLVPNFLHHFGTADCIRFLKKAHDALNPGGKVAIVEFVPNNDRVTPPPAATFSLVMLATTPEGDAYTFEEYATMLTEAGFNSPAKHPLAASVNEVIISSK